MNISAPTASSKVMVQLIAGEHLMIGMDKINRGRSAVLTIETEGILAKMCLKTETINN